MQSRERVRAALSHREPDRIPIDFGSTPVTGIADDLQVPDDSVDRPVVG